MFQDLQDLGSNQAAFRNKTESSTRKPRTKTGKVLYPLEQEALTSCHESRSGGQQELASRCNYVRPIVLYLPHVGASEVLRKVYGCVPGIGELDSVHFRQVELAFGHRFQPLEALHRVWWWHRGLPPILVAEVHIFATY